MIYNTERRVEAAMYIQPQPLFNANSTILLRFFRRSKTTRNKNFETLIVFNSMKAFVIK